MPFYRSIITLSLSAVLLSGCSLADRWVYRPDINQGNYVTEQNVAKLKVGQTKEQVLFIMGSPMLTSVFGDNIWYYIFREKPLHGVVRQKNYVITFNKSNVVEKIDISGDANLLQENSDD